MPATIVFERSSPLRGEGGVLSVDSACVPVRAIKLKRKRSRRIRKERVAMQDFAAKTAEGRDGPVALPKENL